MNALRHIAELAATGPQFTLVAGDAAARPTANKYEMRFFLVMCWMLSVTGLSLPGRSAPLSLGALDPVALIKLGTRGAGFVVFGLILLRHIQRERARALVERLIPLGIFAAWAVASIYWSPMKTVTIGHSSDLVLLAMLAGVAALLSYEEDDFKRIFFHLTLVAACVSLALLVLNLRTILSGDRPADYMQPNDMAKTASAGLLLLVCCAMLWDWKWAKRIAWPAGTVLTLLMVAARSRTALILTPLALLLLFLRFRRSRTLLTLSTVFGLIALVVPYSRVADHLPDTLAKFLARGQSVNELAGLSGRTEMWSIAWRSFEESPIFGHGYYVMTDTGIFEVWGKEQWQTAHNAYLHAVTGLGLIGVFFLAWTLASVSGPLLAGLRDLGGTHKVEFLALVMLAWYCAFGLFELSFFGPIDTAVVIFFALLGISSARAISGSGANGSKHNARTRTA